MPLHEGDVRAKYNAEYSKYERATRRLNDLVVELVEDLGERQGIRPGVAVKGALKTFEKFFAKAQKKEARGQIGSVDDCFSVIKDIARARIVCQTLDDCSRIEELLREHPTVDLDDERTERYNPSSTGYRATHFSVFVDVVVDNKMQAVECELQVMTIIQSAWGEFTHDDFYKGADVDSLIGDLMRMLSDQLYAADQQANRLIQALEQARGVP